MTPYSRLIALSLLALAAAAIWAFASDDGEGPALKGKGFRYVIERHPGGQTKVLLTAAQVAASSRTGDRVEATDVRLESYTEEGLLEGLLTTPDCRYDRNSNTVSSAATIALRRGDVAISGRGFEWNITQRVVRVLQDVKVIIPQTRSLSPSGLLPGKAARETKP